MPCMSTRCPLYRAKNVSTEPGFKPRTAGWEVRMLPLSYAPHSFLITNLKYPNFETWNKIYNRCTFITSTTAPSGLVVRDLRAWSSGRCSCSSASAAAAAAGAELHEDEIPGLQRQVGKKKNLSTGFEALPIFKNLLHSFWTDLLFAAFEGSLAGHWAWATPSQAMPGKPMLCQACLIYQKLSKKAS